MSSATCSVGKEEWTMGSWPPFTTAEEGIKGCHPVAARNTEAKLAALYQQDTSGRGVPVRHHPWVGMILSPRTLQKYREIINVRYCLCKLGKPQVI